MICRTLGVAVHPRATPAHCSGHHAYMHLSLECRADHLRRSSHISYYSDPPTLRVPDTSSSCHLSTQPSLPAVSTSRPQGSCPLGSALSLMTLTPPYCCVPSFSVFSLPAGVKVRVKNLLSLKPVATFLTHTCD